MYYVGRFHGSCLYLRDPHGGLRIGLILYCDLISDPILYCDLRSGPVLLQGWLCL